MTSYQTTTSTTNTITNTTTYILLHGRSRRTTHDEENITPPVEYEQIIHVDDKLPGPASIITTQINKIPLETPPSWQTTKGNIIN